MEGLFFIGFGFCAGYSMRYIQDLVNSYRNEKKDDVV